MCDAEDKLRVMMRKLAACSIAISFACKSGETKARPPVEQTPPTIVADAAAPPPPVNAPTDASPPVTAPATRAAFPEIFDQRRRWVFEMVRGRSPRKLESIKNAPRVFGTFDPEETVEGAQTVTFVTRPEAGAGLAIANRHAEAGRQVIMLVLDDDGIRQLGGWMNPQRPDNIRGFTFPNRLEGTHRIERTPHYGTFVITVRAQELAIAGKPTAVWVAESTATEEGVSSTDFAAWAPGIGPALSCKGEVCLRLVAVEDRSCTTLVKKLCEGRDEPTCKRIDGWVFDERLIDEKRQKPLGSKESEKICDQVLTGDPRELALFRDQMETMLDLK
jgi:hypothetical protein